MELQVVSTTTIQAAPGKPATASAVPLTIFDRFAYNLHVASLYAFLPPTASNAAIKDGLAKTLLQFPTLTGCLGVDDLRRPCIHVGGRGGGALLVEATVASDLADHLPLEPSPELLRLHPPTEGAEHVLQVQLNRFRCGGLVVGATAHHQVADGQAMGNFFVAWGKSVRGLAIDPLPVDRWSLQPRCPPRCKFQHWGTQFVPPGQAVPTSDEYCSPVTTPSPASRKVHNISLHYSTEFIDKSLRGQMRERYTTFETLLAHVWRKITLARGLAGGQFTQINVAVNGRRRLSPPVPNEFFGNLALDAYPRATAKELLEGGIERAAGLIHDAIRRTGDDYFKSFIDFGAMHGGEELKPAYELEFMMYPNLEADSWLGLRFNDLDFGGEGGGGGLCAFTPSWIPAEGVVIFLPSQAGGGGVDVFVTLFEEHAKLLKNISHSLE